MLGSGQWKTKLQFMSDKTLRIGQLAERTGVSVRTLRYYDQIDLLKPARSTTAGYRLYDQADILRLQQIRSLRQLGFSLQAIHHCLDQQQVSIMQVLQMHSRHMREQLRLLSQMCDRIDSVLAHAGDADSLSIDVFLDLIKATTMFEQHYTPEQLEQLSARKQQVGAERMAEVEQAWRDLINTVRHEQQQGTDPASPRMRELAARWQVLIDEFTGGDGKLQAAAASYNRDNPETAQQHGFDLDAELMAYVGRAMQAEK